MLQLVPVICIDQHIRICLMVYPMLHCVYSTYVFYTTCFITKFSQSQSRTQIHTRITGVQKCMGYVATISQ